VSIPDRLVEASFPSDAVNPNDGRALVRLAEALTIVAEGDDRAQVLDEYVELFDTMARVLNQTANALKGAPAPGQVHDWSNLAETARTIVIELDILRDTYGDDAAVIATMAAALGIAPDFDEASGLMGPKGPDTLVRNCSTAVDELLAAVCDFLDLRDTGLPITDDDETAAYGRRVITCEARLERLVAHRRKRLS
jgi:hypothetical protein